MPSVPLRFISPDTPGLVSLKIWESATKTGTFDTIETVADIGSFPGYIDHYTTANARSANDWFAISWVDSGGAETELSAPMQGGTQTLIGAVIERVLARDATLDEHVVQLEAEAAIQSYFGESVDPYDSTLDASYRVKSGLANLTLARAYIFRAVTNTQANKWTAGLVSMDTSTATKNASNLDKAIDRLIEFANRDLNRAYSTILLLDDIAVAGGYKQATNQVSRITGIDLSRGILNVSID